MPDKPAAPDDNVLELAERVLRGIRAISVTPRARMSDAERQMWIMQRAVETAALDMFVLATRPFTEADPAEYSVEDYWLRPLATALAAHWRLRGADARLLAHHAAGRDRDEVKVAVMMQAVLLVQAARQEATTIRIAGRWITDHDGAKSRVSPYHDVDALSYNRWFVARCLREARAILRDENLAPPMADPLPDVVSETTPLDELVLMADAEATRARVEAIYAAARDDTDRALLAGIADGASIADVSRGIGLSIEAGKKRIQRLRRRASGE